MTDAEKIAVLRLLDAIQEEREPVYYQTPLPPNPRDFERSSETAEAERQRRRRVLAEAMDAVRALVRS